jgi:biopolymer transport protein ExbD
MRRKAHPHEHQGELNIVPYLDIMVNLVMFMLMSMTGFVSFQMINVNVPGNAAASAVDTPPPPGEKLNLTVLVSSKGFYIAGSGGVLPPGIISGDAASVKTDQAQPTIPVKGGVENEFDFETLRAKLTEVKSANPSVSTYFLAPDRAIKYDVIVKTMDAARGDPTKPLFPDVAFAAVVR